MVRRTQTMIDLAMAGFLAVVVTSAFIPGEAAAKVYFYTLTREGTLVRYDPDTDRLELKDHVAGPYIRAHLQDNNSLRAPTRVLDLKRQRVVTLDVDETGAHAVLIDLKARTATKIPLEPGLELDDILHIVYPRSASRFYIRWIPKAATGPAGHMVTAVGFDGQVLASRLSPFPTALAPVYHSNGRDFYVADPGKEVVLYHGETLEVLARYNLAPLVQPQFRGPAFFDVPDGRALLGDTLASDTSRQRPWTVFTTDLTLSPQSASPRIATGLSQQVMFLIDGSRTVLLQEMRPSGGSSGMGRLHFFDVASGAKLGVVDLNTPAGADVLGLHPDGRRLFVRTYEVDPTIRGLKVRLAIVDVLSRTVLRHRSFEDIGFASDFIDEP